MVPTTHGCAFVKSSSNGSGSVGAARALSGLACERDTLWGDRTKSDIKLARELRYLLSVYSLPGLPSPDRASAAMRTSGSSIDNTLVDRPARSSTDMALPVSDGLATFDSKLVLVPLLNACPGSIRGRLLTELGDPRCAAKLSDRSDV